MKSFLLKMRPLLAVFLIVAAGCLAIWLLELFLSLGDNITFPIIGIGLIVIFGYAVARLGGRAKDENDVSKQELIKQKMYSYIKGKHSA